MQNASNNQIKLLRKLSRRKYREKERRFFVEGERAVQQVLENNLLKVESLFVSETTLKNEQTPVPSHLYENEVFVLEHSVFTEVADTENTQGILALCVMPDEADITDLASGEGIIIATDAIQDPGNLGTMIRTAAWFGAKALILGKGSVDVYNPKVVRSTAGATGTLPVISGGLPSLLEQLESAQWKTLLLDGGEGSGSLNDLDPLNKSIIVVGNEANGISDELYSEQRTRIRIPSDPHQRHVESLNAAIALGIALWTVHN